MTSLFGTATSQPTAFSFPTAPVAGTSAPSGFSFGFGTGQTTTATSTTGGIFGAAAAPAAGGSVFSFGQPPTTTSVAPQMFNVGGAPTTSAPTGTTGSLFGTGFMTNLQPQNKPGLFNLSTTNMYQQQVPQQAIQQQIVPNMQMNVSDIANFISSLTSPQIFGDERDAIIAKFNQLQAFCGQGKGFFSNALPPIDYTTSNPFCRLKTICYNRLEGTKDEDGLISLVLKHAEKNVKANLQLIIDELFKILGSKVNISVCVESTKTLPDDKTEIIFYITETGITGVKRRIPASESYAFFNQPNVRQLLANNPLLVEQVLLKTMLPLDKMDEYLAIPQEGIDLLVWHQAVADNPDPANLIPYPVLGFDQLKERQKLQKIENNVHESCLQELQKRLDRLEEQTVLKLAKVDELKSVQDQLYHRLLSLVGRYYLQVRRNYSFDASEEDVKGKLDAIDAQLNGPTQIKSRLEEVKSNLNILASSTTVKPEKVKENVDEDLLLEVKQYLRKSQDAVSSLTRTLKEAQADLNVVQKVLSSK